LRFQFSCQTLAQRSRSFGRQSRAACYAKTIFYGCEAWRAIAHRSDINEIFVMLLRAGIDRRHDQSGLCKRSSNQMRGTKCRCYFICRSSFGWACLRSHRTKCGYPSKSRRYGRLDGDRKRKRLEPPQSIRHSDWPVCRSPYGDDLRKGNHLVYRLPTLTTARSNTPQAVIGRKRSVITNAMGRSF
jgi:hypothetical protein